jgi:hypothetical protein
MREMGFMKCFASWSLISNMTKMCFVAVDNLL